MPQLKGRHCDHTLMQYYPSGIALGFHEICLSSSMADPMSPGNMQPFNYQPEDIFWGQLAGCLQSIDSGVTTVVDHAHMSYSPEHGTE